MGHSAGILDIGGGFPVDYLQRGMSIEDFCAPIRAALRELAPSTRVIAEPGRFISAPAAVAVASVMGRAQRAGRWWYYLDDGVYGSYSGQLYDHACYPVEALVPAAATYPSGVAGPTCDSIDVINEHVELPLLDMGDLVVGHVMGAYTWASASEFNLYPRATVLALDRGRLIVDGGAPMSWSRRRVLRAGGALAGVSAAVLLTGRSMGKDAAAAHRAVYREGGPGDRRIALLNLHTDERLEIEYCHAGRYVPEALSAIEALLRDFRTGERHVIDAGLMDYLLEVAHTVGADPVFSVISGYRSAQTNAVLHEKSAGVAQHSLHMQGRAIDVRMAGVDCARLASHAEDLQRVGVGYYRASNFVHLDTGAFRTWKG